MEMNQNIKGFLFDFAGVVGSKYRWIWDFKKSEDFELMIKELYRQGDRGDITTNELIKRIAKIVGIPESQVWKDVYPQIVINKELITLIEQLRKKYKIGLLSNYNHVWLEEIFHKHNLNQYFDAIYISSRHRMIKPEQGAYVKALSMLGLREGEVIFVDDVITHIDAAKKLGINGILYTSVTQLKTDLQNLGIR